MVLTQNCLITFNCQKKSRSDIYINGTNMLFNFFKKKSNSVDMPVKVKCSGYFGKLPSHSDFICYQSDSTIYDGWISLLRQSIIDKQLAVTKNKEYIKEDSVTSYYCLGKQLLLCYQVPSSDRMGRKCPFVIYFIIDNSAYRAKPATWALIYKELIDELIALAEHAVSHGHLPFLNSELNNFNNWSRLPVLSELLEEQLKMLRRETWANLRNWLEQEFLIEPVKFLSYLKEKIECFNNRNDFTIVFPVPKSNISETTKMLWLQLIDRFIMTINSEYAIHFYSNKSELEFVYTNPGEIPVINMDNNSLLEKEYYAVNHAINLALNLSLIHI